MNDYFSDEMKVLFSVQKLFQPVAIMRGKGVDIDLLCFKKQSDLKIDLGNCRMEGRRNNKETKRRKTKKIKSCSEE